MLSLALGIWRQGEHMFKVTLSMFEASLGGMGPCLKQITKQAWENSLTWSPKF